MNIDELKEACSNRADPMKLETFYNAVNQRVTGCSCCHQHVELYAIFSSTIPVKADVISLCAECILRLPDALEIINIGSIGAPPALRFKVNK